MKPRNLDYGPIYIQDGCPFCSKKSRVFLAGFVLGVGLGAIAATIGIAWDVIRSIL